MMDYLFLLFLAIMIASVFTLIGSIITYLFLRRRSPTAPKVVANTTKLGPSTRIRVRVHVALTQEEKIVELPVTSTIKRLLYSMIHQLELPEGEFQLRLTGKTKELDRNASLGEMGIVSDTRLVLENRT